MLLTFVGPVVVSTLAAVAFVAAVEGGGTIVWVAFGVLAVAYPVVLRIAWNRGDDG